MDQIDVSKFHTEIINQEDKIIVSKSSVELMNYEDILSVSKINTELSTYKDFLEVPQFFIELLVDSSNFYFYPPPEAKTVVTKNTTTAPGVYSKITDLSEYVNYVPFSQALFIFFSEKGEDNKLKLVNLKNFLSEFGEPNLIKYGNKFGHQNYHIVNFLREADHAYVLRLMPENATYANLRLDFLENDDGKITLAYSNGINSLEAMRDELIPDGTKIPICFFYPIGRGEYYNQIALKIEPSNPILNLFSISIYEKKETLSTVLDFDISEEILLESFEVSLDQNSKDFEGENNFIATVLEKHSKILRCLPGAGMDELFKSCAEDRGYVTVDLGGFIQDDRQDFTRWKQVGGIGQYIIHAIDERGYQLWGWIGDVVEDNFRVSVYIDRELKTKGWNAIKTSLLEEFDVDSTITYQIRKKFGLIYEAFDSPKPLKYGSSKGLLEVNNINEDIAVPLLVKAFRGEIFDPETGSRETELNNCDSYDFNIVFDGAYPDPVKNAIVEFVITRGDCIAILDNGDNPSTKEALMKRETVHNYDNMLVVLYEHWSKVFDEFTQRDIWVSPLFHVSRLLPKNDKVRHIWESIAGLNRGIVEGVKDVRYHLRNLDEFYLNNLNVLVKKKSFLIWSQINTQKKSSNLQNINIVRLYLYIKKAIENYCRSVIFEENDHYLWSKVTKNISEFLEDVKLSRGLYDFTVNVVADAFQIKQKVFIVNVTLHPTPNVEKIHLRFFVK